MGPAVLLVLAILLVSAVAFFFLQRTLNGGLSVIEKRLKEHSENFVQSANERFISEQFKSKAVLEQSKQSIESKVDHLNTEISRLTNLVNSFEKDRESKYGALSEKITSSVQATQGLLQATNQLSSILGNNQQRGLLGQRMTDEILAFAGLQEGIHYSKDKAQDTKSTRPDYAFRLPSNHKVYMDVKFPLSNYQALTQTQDKESQKRLTEDFIRDVRGRIRELKKRDYINADEQTLDFIILFIPSEEVFSFIHRTAPGLMDEALSEKILMAAPYSLYGVLSIIRQAYDNFSFEQKLAEILKQATLLFADLDLFKKRFTNLGEAIDECRGVYDEIDEKSFKRLEQRARKLEDLRKGEDRAPIQADEQSHPVLLP